MDNTQIDSILNGENKKDLAKILDNLVLYFLRKSKVKTLEKVK